MFNLHVLLAPDKVGPCFPWLVDDMKSGHDYGTCLVLVTDGAHKPEIKLCEFTLISTKSWNKDVHIRLNLIATAQAHTMLKMSEFLLTNLKQD